MSGETKECDVYYNGATAMHPETLITRENALVVIAQELRGMRRLLHEYVAESFRRGGGEAP